MAVVGAELAGLACADALVDGIDMRKVTFWEDEVVIRPAGVVQGAAARC